MASKTLFAAHELDVFTILSRSGGATAQDLATTLAIDERPAEMLLTGCAGLGLLTKADGRYVNSPLAEEYLVKGKPSYFGGFLIFNDKHVYASWGQLVEAVRTNRPIGWDPDVQRSLFDSDTSIIADLNQAMHSLSMPTGRALAGAIDFAKHSRLLDLGGGSGAVDIELCTAYPHLTATVLDLPHVVAFASTTIAAAGCSDRIDTVVGDLFGDAAYPSGHDVILLSLVLHSFREDQGRQILRRCHDCLPSGGTILISELLVDDDKTGPAPAALMSLTMLVEEQGRNYTSAEYGQWLTDAGFRDVHRLPVQALASNGVLVATKP
jgi:SAM-dependent methyltransferase